MSRPLGSRSALLVCVALGVFACDKAATEPRPQQSAPTDAPAPAPVSAPAPDPGPAPQPAPDPGTDMAPKTDPAPTPVAEARPLYYERPLRRVDLEGRTLRELTLMRNTIYARVGQSFRKPWLDAHFRQYDWYQPKPAPELGKLTPTDYDNAHAIVEYEQGLVRKQLTDLRIAILKRKDAGQASPEDDIELELLAVRLGGWDDEPELKPEDLSPLADPTQLDKLLSANQLATLSLRDLRMLRNTIYARRGRPFRSVLLQDYFGGMDWYTPDDGYTDAKLTAIDRKNIRLVTSVEKANGGPLTDYEHKVEEGWFFAA